MGEIVLNSKYAPGIATYGIPGEKGNDGNNGVSMFFIPYEVEENKDTILNHIYEKKIIGLEGAKDVKYEYQNGDTFVQPNGAVYQLYNNDFKNIGYFDLTSQQAFALNENTLYNTNNTNVIITNDNSQTLNTSTEYLFNVHNFSTNNVNNKLIKIQNNKEYVCIDYNNDSSSFFIHNNTPLCFSSTYILKDSSENKIVNNNKFYKVSSIDEVLKNSISQIEKEDVSVYFLEGFLTTDGKKPYALKVEINQDKYNIDVSNGEYFSFSHFYNGKLYSKHLLTTSNLITEDENKKYWNISVLYNIDENNNPNNWELDIFDCSTNANKIIYDTNKIPIINLI